MAQPTRKPAVWRACSKTTLKLLSGGNDLTAPDPAFVWQIVQMGLLELANCCA
jgi:hypothetical protein